MGRAQVTDDQRLTTVGLLFESAAGLRRLFEQRMEAEGSITTQSFDVLIRLARTEGHQLRMSELAAQTALTPSGLTRAIDRLQYQGLVARQVCPEDRRGAFAVLTPSGQELMARAIPDHIAHVNEVLSELFDADEEIALDSLLRKLRDHLFATNQKWELTEQDADFCPGAE